MNTESPDEFEIKKTIANGLKAARLKKKLTMKGASFLTGVSISMISQIEGEKVMPSILTVCKLQTVYGVHLFFTGDGVKYTPNRLSKDLMAKNKALSKKFEQIRRILVGKQL